MYYFFKKEKGKPKSINGTISVRSGTVEEGSCRGLFKEFDKEAL